MYRKFSLSLLVVVPTSISMFVIFGLFFSYFGNDNGLVGSREYSAPSPTPTPIIFVEQEVKIISSDNYDVINPQSQITSPTFYICQDNVKTYSAPEEREEWVSGEIGRGEVIKFSSVSNAHWALISISPTIEYVDMVNVCRQ